MLSRRKGRGGLGKSVRVKRFPRKVQQPVHEAQPENGGYQPYTPEAIAVYQTQVEETSRTYSELIRTHWKEMHMQAKQLDEMAKRQSMSTNTREILESVLHSHELNEDINICLTLPEVEAGANKMQVLNDAKDKLIEEASEKCNSLNDIIISLDAAIELVAEEKCGVIIAVLKHKKKLIEGMKHLLDSYQSELKYFVDQHRDYVQSILVETGTEAFEDNPHDKIEQGAAIGHEATTLQEVEDDETNNRNIVQPNIQEQPAALSAGITNGTVEESINNLTKQFCRDLQVYGMRYKELQRTLTESEHLPPQVVEMIQQSIVPEESFDDIQRELTALATEINDTDKLPGTEREKARHKEASLQKMHEITEIKLQKLSETKHEHKAIIEELAKTSNLEIASKIIAMQNAVIKSRDTLSNHVKELKHIAANLTLAIEQEEQASKSSPEADSDEKSHDDELHTSSMSIAISKNLELPQDSSRSTTETGAEGGLQGRSRPTRRKTYAKERVVRRNVSKTEHTISPSMQTAYQDQTKPKTSATDGDSTTPTETRHVTPHEDENSVRAHNDEQLEKATVSQVQAVMLEKLHTIVNVINELVVAIEWLKRNQAGSTSSNAESVQTGHGVHTAETTAVLEAVRNAETRVNKFGMHYLNKLEDLSQKISSEVRNLKATVSEMKDGIESIEKRIASVEQNVNFILELRDL